MGYKTSSARAEWLIIRSYTMLDQNAACVVIQNRPRIHIETVFYAQKGREYEHFFSIKRLFR